MDRSNTIVRISLCLVLGLFHIALADGSSKGKLDLVKDGSAVCTIVTPENADKWTVTAAEWLTKYVHEASGAQLTTVTETRAPRGTIVSVGHTKLARKAGINVDDLKWDGYKLVVRANVLYLIGRDQSTENKVSPWIGARGTCRAVLAFLEDFCGVRWFLPTPRGEVVPESKNISVPRSLSKKFIPAFAYSDGRSVYNFNVLADPGGTPASLANNFRKAVAAAPGGHTYYEAVPAEKYFKEHPEYFALINGNRTAKGNHLCSSNPDVKRILVGYTRMRFDNGYDWASMGQEDGYRRCECAECEKLDDYRYESKYANMRWEVFQAEKLRETPCERLLLLHKYVADEVKKSHPDKKLILMSYAPTAWPSKKIAYFGDNVIIELMNPNPNYIQAWRDKGVGLVCKTDWFNTQCPMGMNVHMVPREVVERIRFLHKNNFIGLAQYSEANWGFEGPMFYMLGKLLGDPSQDYNVLIAEYCHGVYGKAGNTMLEFFNQLYAHMEKVLPPLDSNDIVGDGRNVHVPATQTTSVMFLQQYPPSFLNQLDGLLQKAEREADTDRARGWVKLTREFLDFTTLLTSMLSAHRDYQNNKTKEAWAKLKERVEAFDAYRMKVISYPKEYTDAWFPGHGEFCKWMTGNCGGESKMYYTSWEENRRPEVLRKGIKGIAMGYGTSYYYSYVKEPLTIDFSKEPE